ncbi:MAG: hypothetical protein F4X72_03115 [Dehalococcoidia bacterium]|nr:hypothetical protein [Dehalococcoidia bacterium]
MNPRSYPRGPRYRVSARPRPEESPRRRRPRYVIAGVAVGLAVIAVAVAVVLLPTFRPAAGPEETDEPGWAATRPRDFAPTPIVPTPTPYPTPTPAATATPRPIPTADPSITTAEIASIIYFANSIMFIERRQRLIIRDYRYYNIDLLTRWIGESVAGAEDLLERQRKLLAEYHKIRPPDIEGAAEVLDLYVDSAEEGVETFDRLVVALEPLHVAGISVVGGIRTGMLPNIGVSEGLARSAMTRIEARELLEAIVNRAGLTLGDVEWLRSPDAEDI